MFFFPSAFFWANKAQREWSMAVMYSTRDFPFDRTSEDGRCVRYALILSNALLALLIPLVWPILLHELRKGRVSPTQFGDEPTNIRKEALKHFGFTEILWRRGLEDCFYLGMVDFKRP